MARPPPFVILSRLFLVTVAPRYVNQGLLRGHWRTPWERDLNQVHRHLHAVLLLEKSPPVWGGYLKPSRLFSYSIKAIAESKGASRPLRCAWG